MKPTIALALSFLTCYGVGVTILFFLLVQEIAINSLSLPNFAFVHEGGVAISFIFYSVIVVFSGLIGLGFFLNQRK